MRITIDAYTKSEIDRVIDYCKTCKAPKKCHYKSRKEVIRAAMQVFSGMACNYDPKEDKKNA